MQTARAEHTMTLLDEGRVLAVGGRDAQQTALATAEIYDPLTDAWTPVTVMHTARAGHTATKLLDGRVLVVGGFDALNHVAGPPEIYDPTTNTWNFTPNTLNGFANHSASLLNSGDVLAAGGSYGDAEVYDPASNTWSPTTGGMVTRLRANNSATLLSSGNVLVAGGYNGSYLETAEVYDAGTDAWVPVGSMAVRRSGHEAFELGDGRVLVVGGENGATLASTELFEPATEQWQSTGSMTFARWNFTGHRLADGSVLVTGGGTGMSDPRVHASTEIYRAGVWQTTPSWDMNTARGLHASVLLADGRVLVAGGYDLSGTPTDSAELLRETVNEPVDLSATSIIAVQVIEGAPLVRDKATVIRVFVSATGLPQLTPRQITASITFASAPLPAISAWIVNFGDRTYAFRNSALLEVFLDAARENDLSTIDLLRSLHGIDAINTADQFDSPRNEPLFPNIEGSLNMTATIDLDADPILENNSIGATASVVPPKGPHVVTFQRVRPRVDTFAIDAVEFEALASEQYESLIALTPAVDGQSAISSVVDETILLAGSNLTPDKALRILDDKCKKSGAWRCVYVIPRSWAALSPTYPWDGLACPQVVFCTTRAVLIVEDADAFTTVHEIGHTMGGAFGTFHDCDVAADGWDVLETFGDIYPARISVRRDDPNSSLNFYSVMCDDTEVLQLDRSWITASLFARFQNELTKH